VSTPQQRGGSWLDLLDAAVEEVNACAEESPVIDADLVEQLSREWAAYLVAMPTELIQ